MKRTVGRPAIHPDHKREHKIIIRVTEEELQDARDTAELESQSISTLGRNILIPALRRRMNKHI